MKVFLKKLKEANKIMTFFYFITGVAYWVTYVFILKSLLNLEGIETTIRIIVLIFFGIYGLIYTIFGLTKLLKKKKVGFILLTILSILFAALFGFASHYIDYFYGKIEKFETKETSTYKTVLLALKETEFKNDSKIGMITDETDRTGYILPLELINKEQMNNEIEYYSNYTELLNALYSKEIDAIFINKDYATIYGSEEKFQNIANETIIIKEYEKEMKTEESELLATTKSLTEPFTVLILGVDSDSKDGLDANAAFNGDTIMLITFNPKTLTATMLSIPRDTYVQIYNSNDRLIGYNKINSSAAYGTASTVNTIEHLTGIEIDYFVKVNFQGVIDLVNTLGGIDINVEAPDYSYYIQKWGEGVLCESDANRTYINPVCMNTGPQHLNGEQALAYARNRYGFLEGDIARNRHQQQVIEAVAQTLTKTANLSDFEKLLDTVSNNIATNMKTSQILSFYQSIKGMLSKALKGEEFISIQKLELTYFSFENKYGLSCIGFYQGSMDAIEKAMKENLGLITISTIKTFHYDYSEDYEQSTKAIGKGIYSGVKVPDTSIYGNISTNNNKKDDEEEEENEQKPSTSNSNTNTDDKPNNNKDNEENKNQQTDPSDENETPEEKPTTPNLENTDNNEENETPNKTDTSTEPNVPGTPSKEDNQED